MADVPTPSASFVSEVKNISHLLWGPNIKEDLFRRWSQGFYFSRGEPTALVQSEGGPCAVLAPVQAYMIRTILSEGPVVTEKASWREVDEQRSNELLVSAACYILQQASTRNRPYTLIHMCDDDRTSAVPNELGTSPHTLPNIRLTRLNNIQFHDHLRVAYFDTIQQVEAFYLEMIQVLRDSFGVLLFLYSVIATKGLVLINEEVSDTSEPLIDSTYGYGSQSLINLMLTGRAVGHVWDHDQDIGGLKLQGISQQGEVGFLALLEHLRYCEVGSFLKNPKQPIWVLASETHLTVLYSLDTRLASCETPSEVARRVFRSFDPDGNNFISTVLLQDVLQRLDLVYDKEYVDIMSKKLDAENLGIILLHAFLDEFFSVDRPPIPDTFTLYHYNGLPRSQPDSIVRYQEGSAVLLECDVKCVLESNPLLTCLQTKWPNIEINWTSATPSLN